MCKKMVVLFFVGLIAYFVFPISSFSLISRPTLIPTSSALAQELDDSEVIYLPLIYRLPHGDIAGQIVNAINGQPIANVTVCVLNVNLCAITDSSGGFTIVDIPAGTQTVSASIDGYTFLTQTLVVQGFQTTTLNFALSPTLAQGAMRIVLTWGAEPRDLDSHLWLPVTAPAHIYWSSKGNCINSPYACLDVDDVTGYGPETITINQRYSGSYTYAVYLYSGSGTINSSGARVQIYDASGLVREYHAPASGSGRWWHVFDFDGDTGSLVDWNYISTVSPGPYDPNGGAGSGSLVIDEWAIPIKGE